MAQAASIRAILFDLDGVLVDAKEWHYAALNQALALFGFEIDRLDHVVTYDGLPTSKKLEILSQKRGLKPELYPLVSELKQRFTMENIRVRCEFDRVREQALAGLRAQGYRLAVCSNSVRDSVHAMLEKSGMLPHLEFFLSNQDVARPKPAPDIYLAAAARMGLDPRECLVVEDNAYGMQAARSAGCRLMTVGRVDDVTLENVQSHLNRAEQL